jgi:hypothetical protein
MNVCGPPRRGKGYECALDSLRVGGGQTMAGQPDLISYGRRFCPTSGSSCFRVASLHVTVVKR